MLTTVYFVSYRIKVLLLLVFKQAWKHLSSKVCEILEELRAVQVCVCVGAGGAACASMRLFRHI